jgi:hypothetical protein
MNWAKRMDMNRHPTTSGSSHLSEGVLLGVSEPNRNQKLKKLPAFRHDFGSVRGARYS